MGEVTFTMAVAVVHVGCTTVAAGVAGVALKLP